MTKTKTDVYRFAFQMGLLCRFLETDEVRDFLHDRGMDMAEIEDYLNLTRQVCLKFHTDPI